MIGVGGSSSSQYMHAVAETRMAVENDMLKDKSTEFEGQVNGTFK